MTPLTMDHDVWIGSQTNIIRLIVKDGAGAPVDLTGHRFIFRATWRDVVILKDTGEADPGIALDTLTSILTIAFDAAESRLLPVGRLARYAIEWRRPDGTQVPLMVGMLTGRPYENED